MALWVVGGSWGAWRWGLALCGGQFWRWGRGMRGRVAHEVGPGAVGGAAGAGGFFGRTTDTR